MEILLPHIQEWFLSKEEHFVTFAEADSRVEGWFKAELLVLFRQLVAHGHLDAFEREANLISPKDGKRKQIDFRLTLQGQIHLCELKALCISQAAGTPRDLHFYFRDDRVGIIKDFEKLDELTGRNKWLLGFVYPKPDLADWDAAVASLPPSLGHWKPVARPTEYPRWAFISLWQG